MTSLRLKPDALPGWPRWLTESLAAAYVGVGQETFRREVAAGIWPQPQARGAKGGLRTWDRLLLDRASDQLSNPSKSAKEQMMERVRGDAGNNRAFPTY